MKYNSFIYLCQSENNLTLNNEKQQTDIMKNFLSVLATLVLLLCSANVSAEVISKDFAKTTADRLLSLDTEFVGAGDATIQLVERDGVPTYYIIRYLKGGWAIVSAQSAVEPLFAYNPTGTYGEPEPMACVLRDFQKQVVNIARTEGDKHHIGWNLAQQRKVSQDPSTTPDVVPLIKVDLNQTEPFNKYCPTIDGQKTLVGCVAVGMAQAMMVARYPDRPVGQYSYSATGIGTLSIDYNAEADYDWDAMYNKDYDKIARLLYQCGVSVNMGYGIDGSGTYTDLVAKALPRNFKYDETLVRHVDKPDSWDEWLAMLLEELVLGRVVVYHGSGESSGHCWNIDGWKQSLKQVHVNWGWGGVGNGYFDLDRMSDEYQGMAFPYANGAVIGVGSPTTAPYGLRISVMEFVENTPAGVALADVKVSCEDETAEFAFEILGPKNIFGAHTPSPFEVKDMKLVSKETVTNTAKFKYALIKVTNVATGESYESEFTFNVKEDDAVSSIMSDAMRVYPSVADHTITVEVPVAGGTYAIYSIAGAQVAEGNFDGYKNNIAVGMLPSGTYLLRYFHNEGVGVKTFIVK